MNFCAGDIVISKAGRDKGKHFIVLAVIDEQFVFVADGDLRRVDNPKRKKWKHLEKTGNVSAFIQEKLKADIRITNPDLKKELAKFNQDV